MRQDGTFTSDTVAKLPSGELPIHYTGAPIKDAEGNIIGALEYVIDISEENRAVAGVVGLVEAAVAGKLDRRGNPDSYTIASFKNVVQGINDTLDAVVVPVNDVKRVTEAIADGNLTHFFGVETWGLGNSQVTLMQHGTEKMEKKYTELEHPDVLVGHEQRIMELKERIA